MEENRNVSHTHCYGECRSSKMHGMIWFWVLPFKLVLLMAIAIKNIFQEIWSTWSLARNLRIYLKITIALDGTKNVQI